MAATVLFGEIDADLRHIFILLFTRAGYTVCATPDRASALAAAVRRRPDLVILNLPGDAGPATCRALHADPRTAGTPVIVMSADAYPDAAAAADAGAEDYITKPFGNDDLLARAHALLAHVPVTHRRPVETHTGPRRVGTTRRRPAVTVPSPAPSGLGPLADNLATLASTPDDAPTLDAQLAAIAHLTVDRVAAVDHTSITAFRADTHATVAASSDAARAVDHAQYTDGEGPCVRAVTDGVPVAVPDIAATTTCPRFRATALTLGLHTSVSLPLSSGSGATIAVLNMHGRDAAAMAPLISQARAVYDPTWPLPAGSTHSQALEPGAEELLTGLARALDARATIQHAIAAIMTRTHGTAANAYLRLRTHAAATGACLTSASNSLIADRR
ncbi:MAG TPA: response regulator [Pilimelia sp.]|nr:response regulator [Pilimelia sp.]